MNICVLAEIHGMNYFHTLRIHLSLGEFCTPKLLDLPLPVRIIEAHRGTGTAQRSIYWHWFLIRNPQTSSCKLNLLTTAKHVMWIAVAHIAACEELIPQQAPHGASTGWRQTFTGASNQAYVLFHQSNQVSEIMKARGWRLKN